MAEVTNVDADDGGDDDDEVVAVAVAAVGAFSAADSAGSSAMVFHYRPAVESCHASWNRRWGFPGYR